MDEPTPAQLAAEERRLRRPQRKSGWKHGQPKCWSCRHFLNARGGWCPRCRTYG